jgi:hypothetical protein
MFRDDRLYIVPIASSFLFVVGGMSGGGCNVMGNRPFWSSSATMVGDILQTDFMVSDAFGPTADKCTMGPWETNTTLYDTKTLRSISVSGGPIDSDGKPLLKIDGRTMKIPGCDPMSFD